MFRKIIYFFIKDINPNTILTMIGKTISAHRKQKKLSQTALAELIAKEINRDKPFTKAYISLLEKDLVLTPDFEVCEAIAKALSFPEELKLDFMHNVFMNRLGKDIRFFDYINEQDTDSIREPKRDIKNTKYHQKMDISYKLLYRISWQTNKINLNTRYVEFLKNTIKGILSVFNINDHKTQTFGNTFQIVLDAPLTLNIEEFITGIKNYTEEQLRAEFKLSDKESFWDNKTHIQSLD